jgi:hypothetical protein
MNEVNTNNKEAGAYAVLGACGAVSVLFTRSDSIYKTLGVDCWDIERDARNWPGGNPIIAHPPCRAWGQLSHMAKPRHDEKELAIWSIEQIRKWGGVLEHPRASKLWKVMNLPMGAARDIHGGFTLSVNQFWWGHKAKKSTLLYVCGTTPGELPPMPLRFEYAEYAVLQGNMRKGDPGYLKRITEKEREATPIEFAKWLIEVAAGCRPRHCT